MGKKIDESRLRIFLKRGKRTKLGRTYDLSFEDDLPVGKKKSKSKSVPIKTKKPFPVELTDPVNIKTENPLPVEMEDPVAIKTDSPIPVTFEQKENRLPLFIALAAMILALVSLILVLFQPKNSKDTYGSLHAVFDSVYSLQANQSKVQYAQTISLLENQQAELMQRHDSALQLLAVQHQNLVKQNKLWEMTNKQQIMADQPKLSVSLKRAEINSDSLQLKIEVSNDGVRVAKNLKMACTLVTSHGENLVFLNQSDASFLSVDVGPKQAEEYSETVLIDDSAEPLFLCLQANCDDELLQDKIQTTSFFKIYSEEAETEFTRCALDEIEFIVQNSPLENVNTEGERIKAAFAIR